MAIKGICIDCGGDSFIVSAKGRCGDCQYAKNHGGKSRYEVIKERQSKKLIKFPKKINKVRQKPPKKSWRKKTGEYNVFLEIWDEYERVCVNCLQGLEKFVDKETGKPIAFIFSHIKSKGARGDLRLLKSNIELNCPDCHYAHESLGDEAYNKRKGLYKNKGFI